MMKNRIQKIYPNSVFEHSAAPNFYIADFTERTNSTRKVEFHESLPQTPEGDKLMDCLTFENPEGVLVACNIFDDNQFKDGENKDKSHCECCLFPTKKAEKIWTAFVEIKDCKPKNISEYKDIVKAQIISTVNIFKRNGIIGITDTVYGIISFPRKNKVSFNQTIFEDPIEYKNLYKKHKIHFYPSNSIIINSEKKITPVL